MRTLHIVTACSRFDRLKDLAENISKLTRSTMPSFAVRWHVAFQHPDQFDLCGARKMNEMVDLVPDEDWVWILDDDNEMHVDFLFVLDQAFRDYPHKRAFVFSQNRWDILGPVLLAKPENMKVGGVDTAQVVFQKSLRGDLKLLLDSKVPDGILYAEMFRRTPEAFQFCTNCRVVNFNAATRPKE